MLDLDRRIGLGDAVDCRAPQAARFEHVGFVDAGHVLAARRGYLERDLGDALYLVDGIHLGIVGFLTERAVAVAAFAEVYAARELADYHDVHAFFCERLVERTGGYQFRMKHRGTEVGEKP